MFKKIFAVLSFFSIVLIAIPCAFWLFSQKSSVPVENTSTLKESIENSIYNEISTFSGIGKPNKITSYIKEQNAVLEIDFEEYIVGVVGAEMPAKFNEEALKAQAVAARSYILNKINSGSSHDNGAVVCNDSTHCKAYLTPEQLKANWGSDYDLYYNKIKNCVFETKDCIMIYNGEIVDAVFHSTSSGKTESSVDVWGKPVPYLVSVASLGEELSPKFHSSLSLSIDEFKSKLKSSYQTLAWADTDQLISSIERSSAGGIINIRFGNTIISGTEFRNLFSLRSTNINFEISDTEITMNVTGNGHGVGMSQYGANYLASQGKNFIEILKSYYSGVEVVKLNSSQG